MLEVLLSIAASIVVCVAIYMIWFGRVRRVSIAPGILMLGCGLLGLFCQRLPVPWSVQTAALQYTWMLGILLCQYYFTRSWRRAVVEGRYDRSEKQSARTEFDGLTPPLGHVKE